jgi:hypothetical protein
MNTLCDGHVARGLVSNAANGFSNVFCMCFALNCAHAMALWLCSLWIKFQIYGLSGSAQGYHDTRSTLTSRQPQLMGSIHKQHKTGITRKPMS